MPLRTAVFSLKGLAIQLRKPFYDIFQPDLHVLVRGSGA